MVSRPASALIRPAPLALVVELINEWGSVPREAAGEQQAPYPQLRHLALKHVFEVDDALGDENLVQTADTLYPLFDMPSTAVLVDGVNELLNRSAMRPSLVRAGGRITEGWTTNAPDHLLAACAL